MYILNKTSKEKYLIPAANITSAHWVRNFNTAQQNRDIDFHAFEKKLCLLQHLMNIQILKTRYKIY